MHTFTHLESSSLSMPTYEYKCTKCNVVEEHVHSITDSPEVKCTACGEIMQRMISLNNGGFIMKGGTPAIHWKEKRLRMKKREEVGIRQQRTHAGKGPKIQPNVAGMEVDSWSDAQKVAKEAGLNHESYTPFIEKEGGKKIVVATH